MITKYYIDESGNTGDLIMNEENLNFSSQEYFTLSCIGLNDSKLDEISTFINQLKKKYKIQNKELKFGKIKHIFGKKIGFILELLKYIEEESDLLIEVVDKKYNIATNITNCLLNPPYYQREKIFEQDTITFNLNLSQWLYDNLPNSFFIKFSNIARNPSEKGLNELFDNLLTIVEKINNEDANSIKILVEETIDDFKTMKEKLKDIPSEKEAFTYFLPLPDKNKKVELIGMLPHISSFTNLHARLNYKYKDNISLVTIIHDNQDHFDEIIEQYHKDAKNENSIENNNYGMTDFNFKSITNLEFQDDKKNIGLQIADIFAGLINRAVPYLIKSENTLTSRENTILLQILSSLYYQKAINFVIPMNHSCKNIFPILDDCIAISIELAKKGISKEDFDTYLLEN